MNILSPQYGDKFMGRSEDLRIVKYKVTRSGIVLITGEKGIGKTNLMNVAAREFPDIRTEIIDGSIFDDELDKLFRNDQKLSGLSLQGSFMGVGGGFGLSWDTRKKGFLEYFENCSENLALFVENAHEIDGKNLSIISQASKRNNRVKFILEVASNYLAKFPLDPSNYELVKLEKLSKDNLERIIENSNVEFSKKVIKKIAHVSDGSPYYAKIITRICQNKTDASERNQFLDSLEGISKEHHVKAIHKDIFDSLEKGEQELIKILALAPYVLTLNLIKAFCGGLDTVDLDSAINGLKEKDILLKRGNYYRIFHSLFREYLREIQELKMENLDDYYLQAARISEEDFDARFLLYEFLDNRKYFKKLVDVINNLGALQRAGYLAHKEGHWSISKIALKRALNRAQDREGCRNKAIILENLGIIYQQEGNFSKSLNHYEQSLKINKQLEQQESITSNYCNISSLYGNKGNFDRSLEYSKKALGIAKDIDLKSYLPHIYRVLGINNLEKGKFQKAEKYLKKSIRQSRASSDRIEAMNTNTALGKLMLLKGKLNESLDYYEKALPIAKDIGGKSAQSLIFGNLANLYLEKGELENALNYCKKAKKINLSLDRSEGLSHNYFTLGRIYIEKGDYENANEKLKKSLEIADKIDLQGFKGKIYATIANNLLLKKKSEEAIENYEMALKSFKKYGQRMDAAKTHVNIGDILIEQEKRIDAKEEYLKARRLAKNTPFAVTVEKRLKELF